MAKKVVSSGSTEFTGTVEEFIDVIGIGRDSHVFMKKRTGTATVMLYWQDREEWFCNIEHNKTKSRSSEPSSWIIAKDLPSFIRYTMSETGMVMYVNN